MGEKLFSKSERIVSNKLIEQLFSGSKTGSHSVAAFPVRAVYIIKERASDDEPAAQLLISVSKRRFKHAVDRNRVKRQLREAWRHQRHLLTAHVPPGRCVCIALLWLAPHHAPTTEVAGRVKSLLTRISQRL